MIKKTVIWFEKHYLISLLIAILIAIFIFYISSLRFENRAPGPQIPYKSVIYHFFIFFILAFFLCIYFVKRKDKNRYWIFIAILIAIAYGITDELHQLFVPNRYCDVNDTLIDSIGIMSAGILYIFRMRKFTPHQAIS